MTTPSAQPLGRRTPPDLAHVDRYPLRALSAADRPTGVPVVLGVNWYTAFDSPERDRSGRWWVARAGNLGRIRGGHAVCLLPAGVTDPPSWWAFYDQGREGACVGFAWCRCMSLLNRLRYDAPGAYRRIQLRDEWPDTPPAEGTSVRAGGETLATEGLAPVRRGHVGPVEPRHGIQVYRWATDVQDVLRALGTPDLDYVSVLNSWGRDGYPHVTRMPAVVLDRLRREDGEVAVPTDR